MRASSVLALLAVALACVAAVHATPLQRMQPSTSPKSIDTLNNRPIIGIVTLANSDAPHESGSSFSAAYVKWLEQAGARVAVVPFNAPTTVLDEIFDGINGLLYTGGGLSLDWDTPYWRTAHYLFTRAKDANDRGDFFPIWGTCMGFQLLTLLVGENPDQEAILKCDIYHATNVVMPLDFTPLAANSKLFEPARYMPADWTAPATPASESIYDALAQRSITQNLHDCGVSPDDFYANQHLPKFFKVLSTNNDLNGLPFVSTIEGIRYPFWGAQWHAERTQFEWATNEVLQHDQVSIAAHAYVANRFVMFARQSQHKFQNEKTEEKHLVYQYTPKYTGNSTSASYPARLTYYFNFKY